MLLNLVLPLDTMKSTAPARFRARFDPEAAAAARPALEFFSAIEVLLKNV